MAERTESLLVSPLKKTPKHKIWLSNLDLSPRGYTPVIFLYPYTAQSDSFSTMTLKTALAKALVVFYPLAGRLSQDPQTGRSEIDCNGEGALFVTAKLDATVEDFKDFTPSLELRKKLVPAAIDLDPPRIVMMLQITHLNCGGIILGLAIHHFVADGYSITSFTRAFCSLARGGTTTSIPPPFFDRTLMRARSPPSICFDHSDYFDNSPEVFQSSSAPFMTANLKLSKKQIQRLKGMSGGNRVSTFGAVTAHVWKCICIARGHASDIEVQLVLPVDLRGRLKPPLPATYFGNPTMLVKVVTKVEKIVSHPLEFTANLIQNAVKKATNEFARSLIDHLESTDLGAKLGSMPSTCLFAVSWLNFPIPEADFGLGPPMLMTRAEMYGGGYVYLTRVLTHDGGISVMLGLETDTMISLKKIFYEEIENIFYEEIGGLVSKL